jgi:hypothetical protein
MQTAANLPRAEFNKPFFMEVVVLACWSIWKQRNGKFFEAETPTFRGWKRVFIHDISMLGIGLTGNTMLRCVELLALIRWSQ